MAAARCPKTSSLAFFQWQVGLNKEDRADPEEQKRREMIVWIQDMVSELEKVAALLCFFLGLEDGFSWDGWPKDRERQLCFDVFDDGLKESPEFDARAWKHRELA